MGRARDLPLLVVLIGIGAAAMLVPAAHALVLGNEAVARAFAQSAAIFLAATAMVGIATLARPPRASPQGQLAALAAAYVVVPVMLAVPVTQAVAGVGLFDAWFEMLSCLTTTGASVLDAPGRLPQSVQLWRALTGWLGGFMILICAAALLAPLDLGGAEVITGRVPGGGVGGGSAGAAPTARLLRQVSVLFPAYAGLTALLWAALAATGTEGFTALTFAMSTLSSSGIQTGAPLAMAGGVAAEVLVFAFLLLGLTRRSLPGSALVQRTVPLVRDPELRTAAVILMAVPVVLFLRHGLAVTGAEIAGAPWAALRAYWGALFMTLSFLTTTGFESASWEIARIWAGLETPGLIFVGLAMAGGGIATTTGGVKLLRIHALWLHGEHELQRIVHPSSVGGGGAGRRRLRSDGAYAAWIFVMLYALTLTVAIGLLTLLGQGLDEALVLGVAAISTTGPLAGLAAEVPIRYAELGPEVRAVLAAAMVLGRLEVLAVLALLAPSAWAR